MASFLLRCLALATLASSMAVAQQAASETCSSSLLAVGSFTDITWIEPPVSGEGVTILNLTLCDSSSGNLTATLVQDRLIPVTDSGKNPSYCDVYNASLICANDVVPATAIILSIDDPTATPQSFDLGGSGEPVHIHVLANGMVATASYGGGTFLTFDPTSGPANPVITTITIPKGNATQAAGDAARQEAPHPHQVLEVDDGEVLIADLGSDAVYQYTVSADGELTWSGVTQLPPGSGPRHVAAGPGGKVYVAAELSLEVLELGNDCMQGAMGSARGICSTKAIAKSANNTTFASAAAIRVSQDTKFVYVSLRVDEAEPDEGAIVGFALMPDGSLGELVGTWSTGGQQPRDINLVEVPGFKEVFVMANRKSNDVIVFNRDETTGARGEMLVSATVNSPVSVLDLGVTSSDSCAVGQIESDSGECVDMEPDMATADGTVTGTGRDVGPDTGTDMDLTTDSARPVAVACALIAAIVAINVMVLF